MIYGTGESDFDERYVMWVWDGSNIWKGDAWMPKYGSLRSLLRGLRRGRGRAKKYLRDVIK